MRALLPALLPALLLCGCSDYGLKTQQDPTAPALDTAAPTDTGAPSTDSAPTDSEPGDSGEPIDESPPEDIDTGTPSTPDDDPRPCSDADPATWQWYGSMPFSTEADPTDSNGVVFYDPSYTMRDFSTVSMPDEGHTPSGYDKVYLAWFDVPDLDHKILISPQSDDGLWLYLNGEYVGHWGGDWQEEGCVNDDAGCLETMTVAPINVTDHLKVGTNFIATRVSNAINNSYFSFVYDCVDE